MERSGKANTGFLAGEKGSKNRNRPTCQKNKEVTKIREKEKVAGGGTPLKNNLEKCSHCTTKGRRGGQREMTWLITEVGELYKGRHE